MKLIVLIFVFAVVASCYSQESGAIKSRWIEISLDSINKDLFTIADDLPLLKNYLSNTDTLLFYEERSASENAFKMYLTFYNYAYADSLYRKHNYSDAVNYIPFLPDENYSYTDSEGYAIFVDCNEWINDGAMCSISPESEKYNVQKIQFDKICKIRIREDFITTSGEGKFVATGISFIKKGNHEQTYSTNEEVFEVQTDYWIDLPKFIDLVNDSSKLWVKFILNRNYKGFQYMQMR